jgi:hypothetical protein
MAGKSLKDAISRLNRPEVSVDDDSVVLFCVRGRRPFLETLLWPFLAGSMILTVMISSVLRSTMVLWLSCICVDAVGAKIRQALDGTCTHYVFTGKAGEVVKEAKALARPVLIVSPIWLKECDKTGTRVAETLFPFSFNENMTIEAVAKTVAPPAVVAEPSAVTAEPPPEEPYLDNAVLNSKIDALISASAVCHS